MKQPEDLFESDHYFHWELNMRMTIARKGLINHTTVVNLRTNGPKNGEPVI